MNKEVIVLKEIPPNNHSCYGYKVKIETIDENTGRVIEGSSCSSCWQVGHDDPTPPIPIGSIVQLPEGYTWETAKKKYISYETDLSLCGRTEIAPDDLIIIESP